MNLYAVEIEVVIRRTLHIEASSQGEAFEQARTGSPRNKLVSEMVLRREVCDVALERGEEPADSPE